jgi:hypothetical protein
MCGCSFATEPSIAARGIALWFETGWNPVERQSHTDRHEGQKVDLIPSALPRVEVFTQVAA